VVDDVIDVAELLAEMLESAGAVAVAVSDPTEALLLLSESPEVWSALVTDFHMPKVSGVDLADVAGRQQPRIPAVLVTALPDQASHHQSLFDSILSKPTDAPRLIAAVRMAISGNARSAHD
jgi:CheY-like chemotaxis protein